MKSVPSLLFFKPMKKEPHAGIRKSPFVPSGIEDGHGRELKPPYRPGEKCYVREVWRPERPIKGTYKGFLGTGYKDGAFKLTGWPSGFEAYPNGKWRSPVTMPQWAARSFVTVLSCEPVRVSEVTEEDAIRYGVYQFHSQSKGLEDKPYYRSLYSAQELFRMLWTLKHPGKEWAWRVVSEGNQG